ncbi:MAG: PhzF family phenazine biosynthesis protein [Alphaproteobacteria bacterium]
MGQPIYQIDAFTDEPFAGNPAAVCVLASPAEPAWMQAVAREMNLSETAFLNPEGEGYRLRWFTPLVEVDLCGHATLASAHLLWELGLIEARAEARFLTRSGLLTARREGAWIVLGFPALPAEPAHPPEGLAETLGARPVFVGRSRFDLLVELESEAAIRGLTPDVPRLATVSDRGVIVTARAERPGYDIVSRYFAPAAGVSEDPVTGSAHCVLAPFWCARLGRRELSAFQASPRGGSLRLALDGDRVRLGGQAVTVLKGELL